MPIVAKIQSFGYGGKKMDPNCSIYLGLRRLRLTRDKRTRYYRRRFLLSNGEKPQLYPLHQAIQDPRYL